MVRSILVSGGALAAGFSTLTDTSPTYGLASNAQFAEYVQAGATYKTCTRHSDCNSKSCGIIGDGTVNSDLNGFSVDIVSATWEKIFTPGERTLNYAAQAGTFMWQLRPTHHCCPLGDWADAGNICGERWTPYYYNYNGLCHLDDHASADTCHGWDCTIEGQQCNKGRPGADNSDFCCIDKQWKEKSCDIYTALPDAGKPKACLESIPPTCSDPCDEHCLQQHRSNRPEDEFDSYCLGLPAGIPCVQDKQCKSGTCQDFGQPASGPGAGYQPRRCT